MEQLAVPVWYGVAAIAGTVLTIGVVVYGWATRGGYQNSKHRVP